MDKFSPPRTFRWLIFSLCVPLLALALTACLPIRPIAAPSETPLPGIVAPPTPNAQFGPVNQALVGLYASDAITWPGAGGWTNVLTLTLSLFPDGTYELMSHGVQDWGTRTESSGPFIALGEWADMGEYAVLFNQNMEWGRFFTLGTDALVFSYTSPTPGIPQDWVLTEVSALSEPLFHCAARAISLPAFSPAAPPIDPTLAGAYASATQFFFEEGDGSMILSLFDTGWAEYYLAHSNDPAQDRVIWGMWWVLPPDANGERIITLKGYGTDTHIAEQPERQFAWDDAAQAIRPLYEGSPENLLLLRSDLPPAPRLAALYDFLFPNPAMAAPASPCR